MKRFEGFKNNFLPNEGENEFIHNCISKKRDVYIFMLVIVFTICNEAN